MVSNKATGRYWSEAAHLTWASWLDMRDRVPTNVVAGFSTMLVALPLNLALALACGLPPAAGLVSGAVAGILSALLGGSRLQVTGPEVALAPLTLAIVAEHGFSGLLWATILAGLLQIAFGLLRLGRLLALVPTPVVGGFLAAVGLLVFDSQIPRVLGLEVPRLSSAVLAGELPLGDFAPHVMVVALVTLAAFIAMVRYARRVPAPLVALVVGSAFVAFIPHDVPTVDAVTSGFPLPAIPSFAGLDLRTLFPEALALALLASLDSILCALSVEARIGGARTRTDQELVAQGLANVASAAFGGMPVAAAVVRSMAAVEAGATTRLAPLVQSVGLALVVLWLGSHVEHVPIASLAAVLLVVGYRLIDWRGLARLWRLDRVEALIFVGTTVGILATDFVLGVAIGAGGALAHFVRQQGLTLQASARQVRQGDVVVLELHGPLFFAGQQRLGELLEGLEPTSRLVVDLSRVTTIDASGAATLRRALARWTGTDGRVWVTGTPSVGNSWIEELDSTEENVSVVSERAEALRLAAAPTPSAA